MLFLKFSVELKCKDDTPSSSWVLCKDDEMMTMMIPDDDDGANM